MSIYRALGAAALLTATLAPAAQAVEGGTGHYLLGTRDDSGSGADESRYAFGVGSLRANISGAGPIISYSGVSLLGGQASFRLRYHRFRCAHNKRCL